MKADEPTLRLAMVAGELSGDTLGAGLLRELDRRGIRTEAVGVGGPAMQKAGLTSWWQAEDIAVMGLAEVVKHLPRLLKLKRQLLQRIRNYQPHAFVGIDLPDFNLRMAAGLRGPGCKTLQYVSPSVWAWRPKRVHAIAAAVDRVLCVLPFEPDFYAQHEVPATFVGHPLADTVSVQPDTAVARRRLKVASDAPVFALLPGSRGAEVKTLAPIMLEAARQIASQRAGAQFITALAGQAASIEWHAAVAAAPAAPAVSICEAPATEVIAASDVTVLASGTVALEALLLGRPMVMTYRLSPLTGWVVNRFNLMHVEYFSLPNLLTDSMGLGVFVPELVQDDAEPDKIAAAALDQYEQRHCPERLAAFAKVQKVLAVDANERAVDALLESLPDISISSQGGSDW
ncbi:MAG: lipid-A-disaccharide synthase [Gammaproteobacteria bacterium]